MSATYPQGVASPYQYPRARVDGDLVRDVVALALLILGVTGLAVAAFAYDWRLGLAVVSSGVMAAGVYLGYRR